ncbi:hypothetical protein FM110_06565 [Brachybacterium nesterenkovii]|uniref:Uncharacterized protein n=1 Tax=Brachybacterium nesterenkovii TaxID=47847 RepID=A0A1X6WZU0_9MICO|nr:hypothetical protein FM110_06565 [Brachybacterium nesterenkovii]
MDVASGAHRSRFAVITCAPGPWPRRRSGRGHAHRTGGE